MRIARMQQLFKDAAAEHDHKIPMQIDIIGFSRGAAQARDFANELVLAAPNGIYTFKNADGIDVCQPLNFRFMGLWDTVLSNNDSKYEYKLDIPKQFGYVAHAIALNEYRSANISNWVQRNPLPGGDQVGGFPLESISGLETPPNTTRIERGFLGAHADIGGGYEINNELSLVALNWMVKQATNAQVPMKGNAPAIPDKSALVHEQSNVIHLGNPNVRGTFTHNGLATGTRLSRNAEDRLVKRSCNPSAAATRTCRGGTTTQRALNFDNNSMTNAETHELISYTARDVHAPAGSPGMKQTTGIVNLTNYVKWLKDRGYDF